MLGYEGCNVFYRFGVHPGGRPENVPDAAVVMPDAEELEQYRKQKECLEQQERPEVQELAKAELEPEAEETQAVENIEADMWKILQRYYNRRNTDRKNRIQLSGKKKFL